ncbi:MAG: hypothetical protein ACFFDS_09300, partial [Candidatus Thorarchaeota archaeon]
YYDQAIFTFYNVTNREDFVDYNSRIGYVTIQGDLTFDVILNKTVRPINGFNFVEGQDDYVVFTKRKQYILNQESSELTGNEYVYNFNYMWPYYLKYLGNGTEYGFQAYVASYLLQQELLGYKDSYGYSDQELASVVLNKTYAAEENLIDIGTYIPHNWISVRPAYPDLDLDGPTSYKILYNATYNGKDYSVLTGDAGSAKFFLDLIRGLDYTEVDDLTVDVEQLLADVYGIDTETEKTHAKSFAAYMNFLLGKPSLNWLFENKISYVCRRTAMEWLTGIEDVLLGNKKFPLIANQSIDGSDVDWNNDLYYALKTGANDIQDIGQILAIGNIPSYERSKSMDVFVEDGLAYVIEGKTDIKIVNTTHPLFLAVGQYGDYSGEVKSLTVIDSFIYATEGERGLEVLNATEPVYIEELEQWGNYGRADMYDIDYGLFGTTNPSYYLYIANGEYGVTYVGVSADGTLSNTFATFNETSGDAFSIDVSGTRAYVGLGTDGIDIIQLDSISFEPDELYQHYDSANFTELNNVLDLKIEGSYLYVLDEIEGLLIFSLGAVLTLEGKYGYNPSESHYNNFYIDSTKVFLTQGEDGLTVVDVSSKSSPSELYRLNGTDHLGTAYGVYADGNELYLADYSEGLIHYQIEPVSQSFIFKNKDELHTFLECWYANSKVQFDYWPYLEEGEAFNSTYDSFIGYPLIEGGLRNQWYEAFFRPFVYLANDYALYYDEVVLYYFCQSDFPVKETYNEPTYWMTAANFINTTFLYTGIWDQMYDMGLKPSDLHITNSLPGRTTDPQHIIEMLVEGQTGTVVDRRDRVDFNSRAEQHVEMFSLLNPAKYGSNPNYVDAIHLYPTWHQGNPGFAGDMSSLFWEYERTIATEVYYDDIKEQFLNQIDKVDTSRTIGAFGSLFFVTIGFAVTSVVLYRTSPEFKSKKK